MDPTLLIGDIVERDSAHKKPAAFSDAPFSANPTGFPEHKKRWRPSAFKQRRAGDPEALASRSGPAVQQGSQSVDGQNKVLDSGFETLEKERIDAENRQKLETMTPQEIAQAQDDILNGINPALIQRLLRRSNIDEPSSTPAAFDPTQQTTPPPEIKVEDVSEPSSTPQPQTNPVRTQTGAPKKIAKDYDEDQAPAQVPPDLFPIVDQPTSTHFPVPPTLPDLDPADPNFLATLHEKYFPELPADPSKLAWMAPVPTKDSAADKESPYYPHSEIAVAALRFDFRGRFLSPRVSRGIPSSKGLHHHGEAPEAAGYTIAELARLARSAVPAQRCMAYQTLGRILYRLGQGEWGKTENDHIAMGVWSAVKQGRVLESLTEATMGSGGHRGSRAYATEALWLFEKGGWRETFKGR